MEILNKWKSTDAWGGGNTVELYVFEVDDQYIVQKLKTVFTHTKVTDLILTKEKEDIEKIVKDLKGDLLWNEAAPDLEDSY